MRRFLAVLALWIAAVPFALAAPWPASCIQPITVGQTVSGELGTSDAGCIFYNPNRVVELRRHLLVRGHGGSANQNRVALLGLRDFILLVPTIESSFPLRTWRGKLGVYPRMATISR